MHVTFINYPWPMLNTLQKLLQQTSLKSFSNDLQDISEDDAAGLL